MVALKGIGLLAVVGMWLLGVASACAEPPPARITIGDLTFSYEPASWHMVPIGEQLVATCLQEDCRGAVVDISRREGETGCTLEAMAAEAERLFPVEGVAYASIFPAGRFALVFARRHDGPTLSSPQFVHGCVAWQGSEYRFAMRPETVGDQSWISAALHRLVSEATAPPARLQEIRLGEVSFHVSTEEWTIADDRTDEGVQLTCRVPSCDRPGPIAVLSSRSPALPCPATVEGYDRLEDTYTQIEMLVDEASDGLDFAISTTALGCRNDVPPRFEACTVHGDRSYHLSTLGPQSCSASNEEIPRGLLTELLQGARIAQ